MKKNLLWILVFSIIGMLFAGYLTISKVVLGYCPLTEPCPTIFGYPACIYGFVLFITLFVSVLVLNAKPKNVVSKNLLKYVSLFGILFALFSIYLELFTIHCVGGCKYSLIIPTCFYGLIMYIVIAYNAWKLK